MDKASLQLKLIGPDDNKQKSKLTTSASLSDQFSVKLPLPHQKQSMLGHGASSALNEGLTRDQPGDLLFIAL